MRSRLGLYYVYIGVSNASLFRVVNRPLRVSLRDLGYILEVVFPRVFPRSHHSSNYILFLNSEFYSPVLTVFALLATDVL